MSCYDPLYIFLFQVKLHYSLLSVLSLMSSLDLERLSSLVNYYISIGFEPITPVRTGFHELGGNDPPQTCKYNKLSMLKDSNLRSELTQLIYSQLPLPLGTNMVKTSSLSLMSSLANWRLSLN